MDKKLALQALEILDGEIGRNEIPLVRMESGGGTSMMLAYEFLGKTNDIDAVPTNIEFDHLKKAIVAVSKKLHLSSDWLNPHFQAFTMYLPNDVRERMITVYSGKNLIVDSLGPEDLLIMKLMAGRAKDSVHIKHLLKMKINLELVEDRLIELSNGKLYSQAASKALDLFYEHTEDL